MAKTKKIIYTFLLAAIMLAVSLALVFGGLDTDASTLTPTDISMPSVFDHNMVLQRGKDINIFGYATDDGREIRATLGDSTATAIVTDGEWTVTLPPMEAEFDLTLTVEEVGVSSAERLVFNGVCVGEVFLVSGQSNAALEAYHLEDIEEHMALIDNYTNLRLYTSVPNLSTSVNKMGFGSWHKPSRDLIISGSEGASRRFSAIGLITGMRLCDELGPDVPVAVMHAARGASKIRAWLSYEALGSISPSEVNKIDEANAYYKENGEWPSYVGSKPHVNLGTVCYNTMIAPLKNYSIAGVIWHQGEGDVQGACFGEEGGDYTLFFTTLVNSWREQFGDENLPFFMVQIGSYKVDLPDEVSEFKAEQYDICASLDNVYLTTTGFDDCTFTMKDMVAQIFIHPVRKTPLSNRLASIIIEKMYTEGEVEYTALPMVTGVRWSSYYTYVTFNVPIKLAYGTSVLGFEQYNGKTWASAVGQVVSDTEIRFYSSVKPKEIRYGFGGPEIQIATGEFRTVTDYSTVGSGSSTTSVTLKFSDGTSMTFAPDEGGIIMMKHPGNLVTVTGASVPVFKYKL